MKRIFTLAAFILSQFGPVLLFYIANRLFGLEVALISTIAWSVLWTAWRWVRNRPIDSLFALNAIITIVFAIVDLSLRELMFFRYEAALANLMVGLFFGASLFGKKPLIHQLAEAQGQVSGEVGPDAQLYFRFATMVWVAYSFSKAAFYAWLAPRAGLEEAFAVRFVVGNITFYALLALTITGWRPFKAALELIRSLKMRVSALSGTEKIQREPPAI